jgi:hypothetical protein
VHLGNDDHHDGFLEVPVYFVEWAKVEVYDEDQEHLTKNWNKTSEIYCRSSVLRKMCCVFFPVADAPEKYGAMFKSDNK